MKNIKQVLLVLAMYFLGMLIGWLIKPISVVRTEFKDRVVNVSVCSDAKTDQERQICFAKDACPLGLEYFTYSSLKTTTDFKCRNLNQ